jgi:6-phospho-3-hexuloisomerase
MDFGEAWGGILDEVRGALAGIGAERIASLCELISGARTVFVTGEGRSGLVGRCFAMRLVHLGVATHFVGETATPRLERGDVLVAISGTGETAGTCALARLAEGAGGRVAAVTAAERSTLGSMAELVVLVPAGESRQYGGSLFEQSALIALDAVVSMLQKRLGVTAASMDSRHANLE